MSNNKPTYYLYVKKCPHCELKYFGFTKSVNPYLYEGSGTYWISHRQKYDTRRPETLEIWGFDDREICSEFALTFSFENNIVDSPAWANLKWEDGEYHGWFGYNTKGKTYEEIYGDEKALQLKLSRAESNSRRGATDKTKQKISDALSGRIAYNNGITEIHLPSSHFPPEGYVKGGLPLSDERKISIGLASANRSEKTKKKMSSSQKKRFAENPVPPEQCSAISKRMKGMTWEQLYGKEKADIFRQAHIERTRKLASSLSENQKKRRSESLSKSLTGKPKPETHKEKLKHGIPMVNLIFLLIKMTQIFQRSLVWAELRTNNKLQKVIKFGSRLENLMPVCIKILLSLPVGDRDILRIIYKFIIRQYEILDPRNNVTIHDHIVQAGMLLMDP